MTDPQPITGEELEEMKRGYAQLRVLWNSWSLDVENEDKYRTVSEQAMSAYFVKIPRCIAEIERLRAALKEISKIDPGNDQSIVAYETLMGVYPPRVQPEDGR